MKKENIKLLSGLLAFGILLACTQTPEQIAEKAKNSTVLVSKYANGEILGIGSGFFVKRDQIVTNIHVVAGADKVDVRLVGKKTVYTIAGVVAFDAKNDIVILQIAEEGTTPLSLTDGKMIRVDEPIVVVGNPGGVEGNVAHGTIHGTRSDKLLRLKTGISEGEGYSGGPVLNSKGRVIGIVVGGNLHYTYAIPSTDLSKITLRNQKLPEVESLSNWQKRPEIIVYSLLNFASRTDREIHNAMQLNDIDEEKIKYLDIAIENCTIVIKSYIELNLSQTFAAGAYQIRGSLWYFRGAYDKAIKDFEEVFKLIPDYDSSVYNNSALVRSTLGQSMTDEQEAQRLYKEAIKDLDKAIRLNPDNVNAYYNRAIVKSTLGQSTTDEQEAQRLYKETINDYTKAINRKQHYADAYHSRGNMKLKLADFYKSKENKKETQRLYEEAIEDLDEAIRLNPDYVDAYYSRGYMKQMLADFYKSEGNKEEAQRFYEEAIEDLGKAIRLGLDPNLKTSASSIQKKAKEALEQLKK